MTIADANDIKNATRIIAGASDAGVTGEHVFGKDCGHQDAPTIRQNLACGYIADTFTSYKLPGSPMRHPALILEELAGPLITPQLECNVNAAATTCSGAIVCHVDGDSGDKRSHEGGVSFKSYEDYGCRAEDMPPPPPFPPPQLPAPPNDALIVSSHPRTNSCVAPCQDSADALANVSRSTCAIDFNGERQRLEERVEELEAIVFAMKQKEALSAADANIDTYQSKLSELMRSIIQTQNLDEDYREAQEILAEKEAARAELESECNALENNFKDQETKVRDRLTHYEAIVGELKSLVESCEARRHFETLHVEADAIQTDREALGNCLCDADLHGRIIIAEIELLNRTLNRGCNSRPGSCTVGVNRQPSHQTVGGQINISGSRRGLSGSSATVLSSRTSFVLAAGDSSTPTGRRLRVVAPPAAQQNAALTTEQQGVVTAAATVARDQSPLLGPSRIPVHLLRPPRLPPRPMPSSATAATPPSSSMLKPLPTLGMSPAQVPAALSPPQPPLTLPFARQASTPPARLGSAPSVKATTTGTQPVLVPQWRGGSVSASL